MEKQKDAWQIVYGVCFLAIISMVGISVIQIAASAVVQRSAGPIDQVLLPSGPKTVPRIIRSIESRINHSLQGRSKLVDLYGLLQRGMGKWQAGKVMRDRDNMLHMMDTIPSEETLLGYSQNLITLEQAARRRKTPFLYVQAPSDLLPEKTRLPYGVEDVSNQRIDFFLHQLDQAKIPVLDTRILFQHWKPSEVFYATDHHWTTAAAFTVMGEILSRFNAEHGMALDPDRTVRDPAHYLVRSFPDSFLGSCGVRVGQFFVGKDDFSYYEPSFETALHLQSFKDAVIVFEREGTFSEALIDPAPLRPNYKNKYNAFLYAQTNELRIINKMGKGQGKCLIIADSFARCMAPYLSLCFEQTVLLDPQPGRYRKDYIDYIDSFQPDVIVVLFNGLTVYTDIPFG